MTKNEAAQSSVAHMNHGRYVEMRDSNEPRTSKKLFVSKLLALEVNKRIFESPLNTQ